MTQKLTREKILESISYNPDTGIFIRSASHGKWEKGAEAGTLQSNGYVVISIKGADYYAHRLAWVILTGEWPAQIDHIDHARNNNKWINLREATPMENQKNASLRKDNTSGVCGVRFCIQHQRWIAKIKRDRKNVHLGSFKDKFEAICARMSANNKYGFHENHGR